MNPESITSLGNTPTHEPNLSELDKLSEKRTGGLIIFQYERKSLHPHKSIIVIGIGEKMTIKREPKKGYLHVTNLDASLRKQDIRKHGSPSVSENLQSNRPVDYSCFKLTVSRY